jgi:hypothetical protein
VTSSNKVFNDSNAIFPQVTFGSNLAVTSSNALYPQTTFASNLAVISSNALYPQTTFASNLAVTSSNKVFNDSNALYPQTTFASNLAVTSSNKVFNDSNALYPQTTFASNLAVTSSNALYPQSTFASNTSAYSSNFGITNSNIIYPSLTFASNTAVYASNQAYLYTNAYAISSAWTVNSSNVYIINSNIGIETSNPIAKFQVNGDAIFNSNLTIRGVNYNIGREYFTASNWTSSSTSLTNNYTTFLTLNANLEGGNYDFSIFYGMRSSTNNRVGCGRVQLSNSAGASQFTHLSSNSISTGGDSWINEVENINLPSGSNKFIFAFNAITSSTTVTLSASRMYLMRMN